MRIVYGPVPSWRLGRSLGVDPLGGTRKRCTFDCVYCQLGPTPHGPVLQGAWADPSLLAEELRGTREVPVDYVTFAGMGEPTLATNLQELLRTARELRSTPLAALTNASLLNAPSVQAALHSADYVIAKLDAGEQEMLLQVNRPRIPCAFEEIIQGIYTFRQGFAGRLALQIMFVAENAAQAELLAALARWLRPDEVQLNTPLRPSPTVPLSQSEMRAIARHFDGLPHVQVYEVSPVTVVPLDQAEMRRRRPEARKGMEQFVS